MKKTLITLMSVVALTGCDSIHVSVDGIDTKPKLSTVAHHDVTTLSVKMVDLKERSHDLTGRFAVQGEAKYNACGKSTCYMYEPVYQFIVITKSGQHEVIERHAEYVTVKHDATPQTARYDVAWCEYDDATLRKKWGHCGDPKYTIHIPKDSIPDTITMLTTTPDVPRDHL